MPLQQELEFKNNQFTDLATQRENSAQQIKAAAADINATNDSLAQLEQACNFIIEK